MCIQKRYATQSHVLRVEELGLPLNSGLCIVSGNACGISVSFVVFSSIPHQETRAALATNGTARSTELIGSVSMLQIQ
jgi:hypothetical protein